jgi:NitT/TauT family transport system substrate-binding protein
MSRLNLTRRALVGSLAALPFMSCSSPLFAQARPKVKFIGAAAAARPDQGFMFLGIPLGFYNQLGVEGDFFTVAGSASVIQLIAANEGQLGHVGMLEILAAKKQQPNLPVRAVYIQESGGGYDIVVPTESPIRSVAELAGKRIGVISLGSTNVPFVKGMLRSAKVDESSVEILPVGTGAQALAALKANRVDALSLFHAAHATIENLGIELRYFSVNLPSSVLITNENFRQRNRDALVNALQGVVLNTVYMTSNPEAAVRESWSVIGKPKDDEAKALREGAHVIRRGAEAWKDPKDSSKWGAMSDEAWLSVARFMGVEVDPQQLAAVYTNDLIEDVNKVDLEIARRKARG